MTTSHESAPSDIAKWYTDEPPPFRPDVRAILENYAHIPPAEVEAHVRSIRDKAWQIHPYPCIGQWRFLDLAIGQHTLYPEILSRMLTGEQIYLDLGCAFAQDIRKLVADGVESRNCYGADLRLTFMDLGYELFHDRETLESKFIEADIFDDGSELKQIYGEVDVVGASSFFHLFSWEEQKSVAHQVLKLMKPREGSLLVGRQVGSKTPDEKARRGGSGTRYRHNLESWRNMWKEVSDEAGVQVQVDGKEGDLPEWAKPFTEVGDLILHFSVRRM